jgi:hypothetical protein
MYEFERVKTQLGNAAPEMAHRDEEGQLWFFGDRQSDFHIGAQLKVGGILCAIERVWTEHKGDYQWTVLRVIPVVASQ